jgi:hypothetical protein
MGATQVVIDGDHALFWSGGAMWQVALDGEGLTQLAPGDDDAGAFAVGAQEIAWVDAGHHDASFADGRIRAVARTGGTPRTLADQRVLPNDIAMFDRRLYWGEIDGEQVVTTDLDGLDLHVLASSGEHESVVAGAAGIAWTEAGITTGRVLLLRPGATTAAPVVDGLVNPGGLVLVDMDLYWMTYRFDTDETTVMHADLATGHVEALAHEPSSATSLTADATAIYLIDHDSVLRAPKTGGAFTALASQQTGAFGIAVSGNTLIWTDQTAVQALGI